MGCTVHPATIDGCILTVPINSVIHPRYEEVVRGEGIPFPKDLSRKGNLRLKFDIEFPIVLTAKQKAMVTSLFGPQRNMMNKDGHGSNKVVDDHIPCLAPQAVNRTMAGTHVENSRPGRIVYIGSVPVCVD
ncbi:hypothetical protein BS78_05G159800 [Paspalum vaginatum]|nr:hypothetical protein BS78_05G159800 [Paspalum vaginatum]